MTVRDIFGGLLQVAGVRRDADTAEAANGQPHRMVFNARGRLKVSGEPADYDPVTGSLGAVGATVVADVSKCSNVIVQLTSGTFTGLNFVFEGSIDNQATWVQINMVRSNSATTSENASGTLAAAPNYAWEASVNAYTHIRVRATAWASGSAAIRITLGSYATEPMVVAGITGGSVSAVSVTPALQALVTAATTNAVNWAASAVTLFELSVFNPTASAVFVKVYNKTSAPTVGTDVPIFTIPVAAGEFRQVEFGRNGKRLSGLSLAVTAGAAATDTAAVGAGVQISASRT